MHKALCWIQILIIVILVPACRSEYYADGIENYATVSNSYEIDRYLLPCKDFSEKFKYLEADYHHRQKMLVYEKSIAYFKYSPEVFDEALQFSMSEMVLLSDVSWEVNGYTFLQRDASVLYPAGFEPPSFPHWFWMMFYSEERGVIGFIGYYKSTRDQKIRADEDFERFLKHEFPSFDWDD